METEIEVELHAPPVEHAILVLQGRPMPPGHVELMKQQLDAAMRHDKWPIILNYDGPVYWLASGPPAESESS